MSPASTPIPALALPRGLSATPARSAVFLNVPLCWLIQSSIGVAIIRDVEVDPAITVEVGACVTPGPARTASPFQQHAVTSVKVPSRLL